MLTCDDYISPATLDEAFGAMAANDARYRIVAGATDILPWAREGRAGDVHIPVLIDVAGITELNVREVAGGKVRLGAATRFQRFLDDKALMAALPVMPFCSIWFADDQIRESATIGGNLVNASPAADGTPALLAHDATVVLAAKRGSRIERRTLPLGEFMQCPSKTAIAADELLIEVSCDALPGHSGAFEKVGHRRSLVISTVCVAALVELDQSKRAFRDVRLAVAGIGPVPRRIDAIEAALKGQRIEADRIVDAAGSAAALVASRSRQEYRREVVQGFVVRAIVNAARRAGADAAVLPADIEAAYA
jgi:carbon-monoxide dehydrogenase medium subunit/xanthine dehydrogenase FAD-binding subunit